MTERDIKLSGKYQQQSGSNSMRMLGPNDSAILTENDI